MDQEKIDLLFAKIEGLEKLVKDRVPKRLIQKKDWMTLNNFVEFYEIGRTSWYDHYEAKIKHRNDGTKIWVYTPSMDLYLMDKSIN